MIGRQTTIAVEYEVRGVGDRGLSETKHSTKEKVRLMGNTREILIFAVTFGVVYGVVFGLVWSIVHRRAGKRK
jgi:hypothetical protein